MGAEREHLDLRGVPCPKNTAQALLRLEMIDDGVELEILVDDGEPVENMLNSFEVEGIRLVRKERPGAAWLVVVVKDPR